MLLSTPWCTLIYLALHFYRMAQIIFPPCRTYVTHSRSRREVKIIRCQVQIYIIQLYENFPLKPGCRKHSNALFAHDRQGMVSI